MYISQYNDERPRPEDYAVIVKRLSIAFPQQTPAFFALAVQEMADMGFSRQRMYDSATNLIRTFQYKQPNISDLVSFDKRRRLYSYSQMISMLKCNGGTYTADDFEAITIDEQKKPYWALKKPFV